MGLVPKISLSIEKVPFEAFSFGLPLFSFHLYINLVLIVIGINSLVTINHQVINTPQHSQLSICWYYKLVVF